MTLAILGTSEAACASEFPGVFFFWSFLQGGGAESSEEDEEVEASHTDQFPVAVEGLCEAGEEANTKRRSGSYRP